MKINLIIFESGAVGAEELVWKLAFVGGIQSQVECWCEIIPKMSLDYMKIY